MENLADSKRHPCRESIDCCYKVNNTCVYWELVKATLSVMQEKHHKGASCILNMIDIFREPCLEPDEERRRRGMDNMLGLTV